MLSLYIHIPFCVRKCNYCGFYSTVFTDRGADLYLSGLKREIQASSSLFNHSSFQSVYIGGGTPTVLSPDQLDRLDRIISGSAHLAADAEFTVEANPNSLTVDRLSGLRTLGVNRLSLGIQSFSDELLAFLGRIHTAQDARTAFGEARAAGFKNIGMDLMYGIPGQTADEWRETLSKAVDLRPEHISAYSLSLDEGSRFRQQAEAGAFTLPDDESVAMLYELGVKFLSNAGYEQYEISNFSLPGFASRHNLNYWARGEYRGLGPGAWSFMGNKRWRNLPDVAGYTERLQEGKSVVDHEESIDSHQAANEKVMLALRTSLGLDLEECQRVCGAEYLRGLEERAAPLERSGMITHTGGRLRLSGAGFLLANQVLTGLIL